jgi:predicted DNA-binding protein
MKPRSSKNGDTQNGQSAKLSLRVSVEAYRRLFVTSVMLGKTASAIVDDLIVEGLKRFSMPSDLSKRHLHQSAAPTDSDQSPVEIAA